MEDIDFDEAWRTNKKKVGKTSFEYVCGALKRMEHLGKVFHTHGQ